jgi:AraC-like DNA-binding protein
MAQSQEPPLAYLGFQLIEPAPVLRPYVRSYWCFERPTLLLGYHEEFMHPTGGFGIVFNFGDQLRLDAQPLSAPVFLDGVNTMTRSMGFTGHIELMGIRFREGGAFPFLGIPLIAVQNQLNVLDALGDVSLRRLHTRLLEAGSVAARIGLVEGWLLQRLSMGATRSALIPVSLARLREETATLRRGSRRHSIPELAQDLAVSQRQLEYLYRSQVGMSPSQYFRLQRIETARLMLAQQKQPNTYLAAELGYSDQAHFIRDFSAVIGMTPYAYMLRKHPR